MLKRLVRGVSLALMMIYFGTLLTTTTYAETLASPNYKLDESVVGAGGLNQSSSTNYKVSEATGDIAVGDAASSTVQIKAGSNTTNDPALSFSFISPNANFGIFTPASSSVSTASFSVSNYTSYGYVVQIFGNAPSNGSHTIAAMATTGDPTPGTDQFGINLVANTAPVSVGANPDNGQFGFGSVTTDYSTSNKYRYASGETIAQALKSSGKTIYTISYLINVAGLTPGGQYNSNQTIIITGTY